jgi:hypothetical protein
LVMIIKNHVIVSLFVNSIGISKFTKRHGITTHPTIAASLSLFADFRLVNKTPSKVEVSKNT